MSLDANASYQSRFDGGGSTVMPPLPLLSRQASNAARLEPDRR